MWQVWFESSFKLNTKLNWKSVSNMYNWKHSGYKYIPFVAKTCIDRSKLQNFNVKTCNLHAHHTNSSCYNHIYIIQSNSDQSHLSKRTKKHGGNCSTLSSSSKTSAIRIVSFLSSNFSNDTTKIISIVYQCSAYSK